MIRMTVFLFEFQLTSYLVRFGRIAAVTIKGVQIRFWYTPDYHS